jgi:hypothetical protein
LPGNDDLVDRENCPGSLGRKLDSPLLGHQQIQDALFLGIQRASIILVLDR